MEIDSKAIIYGILIIIILLLILVTFGIINLNLGKTTGDTATGEYNTIPEKCRPPAGQDINSWKEHLSHHSETQDCLQYFK